MIKLKTRRAQAAMEFLMTYGWAILVVLVVISALAYLGVLNPQSLVPEKCTISPLNCLGASSDTSGNLIVVLTNPLGTTIKLKTLNITSASGNIFDGGSLVKSYDICSMNIKKNGEDAPCSAGDGLEVAPGDQVKLTTDSPLFASGHEGSKGRLKVKLEYEDTGAGLTKYADGEIVVRINRP